MHFSSSALSGTSHITSFAPPPNNPKKEMHYYPHYRRRNQKAFPRSPSCLAAEVGCGRVSLTPESLCTTASCCKAVVWRGQHGRWQQGQRVRGKFLKEGIPEGPWKTKQKLSQLKHIPFCSCLQSEMLLGAHLLSESWHQLGAERLLILRSTWSRPTEESRDSEHGQ